MKKSLEYDKQAETLRKELENIERSKEIPDKSYESKKVKLKKFITQIVRTKKRIIQTTQRRFKKCWTTNFGREY